MSQPMMRLGSYTFSLSTAAYQEFQRDTEYMWAAQGRVGQDDTLQSTGNGADTLSLPGVIFPEFMGGTGQLDALRGLAARKQPLPLINGRGQMLGEWVILNVAERGSVFAERGVARKQEFNVKLRRAPEESGASGLIQVVAGVLPSSGILSSAFAVAVTAEKGPASLLSSLTGSLSTITGMASQIGSQAGAVLGAVQGGINAARSLQNAGADAGRLLSSARGLASIPSAMNSLADVGGRAARAAGASSTLLDQARTAVTNGPASAAVRDAMIATNKITVMAAQVHATARNLVAG